MKFITPTTASNFESMRASVYNIIDSVGWSDRNQIGLNYRLGAVDTWRDAVGSLRHTNSKESDFNQFNNIPSYLMEQLEILKAHHNFTFGRIRIMRMLPRAGLSVHRDHETRFHYVIDTNPKAYFLHTRPNCLEVIQSNTIHSEQTSLGEYYHLPADGRWYHVDTREIHTVYNGGDIDRIHIVVCAT